jgi:hypothetical protein
MAVNLKPLGKTTSDLNIGTFGKLEKAKLLPTLYLVNKCLILQMILLNFFESF